MNIAIVSGSARPKRQSHQVALEVQRRLNDLGVTNWIWDVKEMNLPLLDYTFDTHPEPGDMLKDLKLKLDQTTGFIVISPEHNGSYSGALKNAMDYFFKEYENKAFGFITVSAGVLGGINALKSLQHYGLKLNGIVCPQFLITPQVQKLFTDHVLTDESYGQRLEQFLNKFIAFSKLISKSN
jgi:NAD(P)H-dependent FMN reductase